MFKENDIVVVTEAILKSPWTRKKEALGYMTRLSRRGADDMNTNQRTHTPDPSNKYGINYDPSEIRLATPEEAEAYRNGITHIQNIPKPVVVDKYEIF